MTDDVLNYSRPGPFTSLDSTQLLLIEGLPDDPVGICAAVQSLVIQPAEAAALGAPEDRIAEKNIRPVTKLITALTALDPAPLHQPRTPETRVIGTCRHFATVACAILRARGIASRARCGFGTYFLKDRGVDHWITEYWDEGQHRWVRVDTEHLGPAVLMDSTTPGAELDEEYPNGGGLPEKAPVSLPAGRWRVRALHTTGEFPWVDVVQLLPEEPC
jgi:hypothetical protein